MTNNILTLNWSISRNKPSTYF